MVEQELIGAEEEGAAAARHVEHAEGVRGSSASEIGGASAFNLFADGVMDDVVHDVGGGVVHAAGLAHFGFLLDFGLMSGGQADDFAEEAFINRTEDFHG